MYLSPTEDLEVQFAEEFKLQLVIAGGSESWMTADVLAQKNIPVILSKTHDLPASDDVDMDAHRSELARPGKVTGLAAPSHHRQASHEHRHAHAR